mgnify:FL=1|tara:strand:- start:1234 stop:1800 length:567 start_codon:yes stop_codon:yes gene_type:complete
MLDSLLAGVMLFSSLAVRTPNTQPNPDDYEVSIGVNHPSYHFNRQWERELGTKYIDDLFWIKYDDWLYFKPEYMNKESKGVKYAKLDWRRTIYGISLGFTTRSTDETLKIYDTFASIGYSNKKTYAKKVDVEFSFDGYSPPDEQFEYENKFKVSWKLTDKVRLYNLGEVSKLKSTKFYKAKVGLEYTF